MRKWMFGLLLLAGCSQAPVREWHAKVAAPHQLESSMYLWVNAATPQRTLSDTVPLGQVNPETDYVITGRLTTTAARLPGTYAVRVMAYGRFQTVGWNGALVWDTYPRWSDTLHPHNLIAVESRTGNTITWDFAGPVSYPAVVATGWPWAGWGHFGVIAWIDFRSTTSDEHRVTLVADYIEITTVAQFVADMTGPVGGRADSRFDVDSDGDVDLADFAAWQRSGN